MNPAFIAAAMDNNGSQQTAIDLKKAGQLTSFTNQLVVGQKLQQAPGEQMIEDMGAGPETIDFDVNLSQMQSPEYSNDVNSKAVASRKRQLDAMNIKKTQSMKRMMLEK